jgi:hypothetical protein
MGAHFRELQCGAMKNSLYKSMAYTYCTTVFHGCTDSKSGALKSVSVRVRPLAPNPKRAYSNVSSFFMPGIYHLTAISRNGFAQTSQSAYHSLPAPVHICHPIDTT